MAKRRRPPGTTTPIPIETDQEYQKALAELEVLQKQPLGTPATEGLQDLIEAILDYEQQQAKFRLNGGGH